jgi:hypothetical protein
VKQPRLIFNEAFMNHVTPLFVRLSARVLIVDAHEVTEIMDALTRDDKVPPAWTAAYSTDESSVVKKLAKKYDDWLVAQRPDGMKEKPIAGKTWSIAQCSSRSQTATAHNHDRAAERNKKLKKHENFEREALEGREKVREDGEALLLDEPVLEAVGEK